MSIATLDRVTFAGLSSQKQRLLGDLQERGCLELIPLRSGAVAVAVDGSSKAAREALKFLLTCPERRRQVSDANRFDAAVVEQQTLALRDRIQRLESERDALVQRLANAKPWGDFHFSPLEEMGGQHLWFYAVPRKNFPDFEAAASASSLPWQVVRSDPRFHYVVAVAESEPESMPVSRVRLGSKSPGELARRLDDVELEIEDARAERTYLTRWCLLFSRALAGLDDAAACADAAERTCDVEPLFALQAWAPRQQTAALAEYAAKHGYVFESQSPGPDDKPPTLLVNPPRVSAGEDLVRFYMTPGYWTWDPSIIVFLSFSVFFAMIMADAGYAAVMGLGLLVFWRRLGSSEGGRRFRPLLTVIIVASLVYGVLVGSYFGVTPPQGSLLDKLHWLDFTNSKLMMGLSVLVGAGHVILANVLCARQCADPRDGLASLGWAGAVAGGLLIGCGAAMPVVSWLKYVGVVGLAVGLVLIVGFTAWREKPLPRLVQGLLGLTKISGAFGDVLSYLRLFALGLASASLAIAFNDMAAGIRTSMPRLGMILALLILLLGHALNLLLGISSGVIHGLRLNVIEFFNWAMKDEGRHFTPFRRREGTLWKQ